MDSWLARSWTTLDKAERAHRSKSGSVKYHQLCLFHGRFFWVGGRHKLALDGARWDVIWLVETQPFVLQVCIEISFLLQPFFNDREVLSLRL